MNLTDRLAAAYQPALDRYGAELEAHGQSWDTDPPSCRCGWRPRRLTQADPRGRRAIGLHISAAERRASKACDEEMRAVARRVIGAA